MKLGDINPFRRKAVNETKPSGSTLTPKDVWEAPVDYNRATRRWAGLTSDIWHWNPTGPVAPRYVRRHFTDTLLVVAKDKLTRRQRRHRANILRAMAPYGGVQ